jgi:hypothetical protein
MKSSVEDSFWASGVPERDLHGYQFSMIITTPKMNPNVPMTRARPTHNE